MKPLRGSVRRLVACSFDDVDIYGRRTTRAPNNSRCTRDFMHIWRLCIAIVIVLMSKNGVCLLSQFKNLT